MGKQLSSLGVKFSLLLAFIWMVGGLATIATLSNHLNAQAEQTMRERADIVLTAMQAARTYTQDNIQPLIDGQETDSERFVQESIPNFAARQIFENFRQQDSSFLDYAYKEAAVNPTNPEDRADDFERALFPQQQALDDVDLGRRSGYRLLNGQQNFYLAQPLAVKDASCLACHGDPSAAPKSLLALYGDRNGFGWNLNEIVAAQIVYVPADMIFARGRQNLWTVTKTFLGVFGALFVTINLLLWRTVLRPLRILTGTAKSISSCTIVSGPSTVSADDRLIALTARQDEPGQLARAFDYMLSVLGQREQDLQRAVDQRTRSLQIEMRDRKAAQSALQTYAHAMNHDLRNVAMGISSVVQGLLYRSELSAVPEQSAEVTVDVEAIALIQKSCDRQLKLMDRLMELRDEASWQAAIELTAVDLRAIAADAIGGLSVGIAPVTIENQISGELPAVKGDAVELQRVFANLVGNAMKYNPDGVSVTLSAEVVAGSRRILCQVADSGIGIEPTRVEALFAPYRRGQQRVAGYGLGLYICKEIIAAHGGEIGISAESKQGACFWFTLRVAEC